jgi:hypothetical protein
MVKHSIVPGFRSIEKEAVAGSIHTSSNADSSIVPRGEVIVLVMVICC